MMAFDLLHSSVTIFAGLMLWRETSRRILAERTIDVVEVELEEIAMLLRRERHRAPKARPLQNSPQHDRHARVFGALRSELPFLADEWDISEDDVRALEEAVGAAVDNAKLRKPAMSEYGDLYPRMR